MWPSKPPPACFPSSSYFHLERPPLTDEGHWENRQQYTTIPPGAGFPGQYYQYYDAESNLHYNTFRDYDLQTGWYIQSDPIGILQDYSEPQMQVAISIGLVVLRRSLGKLDMKDSTGFLSGLNTYEYVEGNPISYVDPLGLMPPGADPECFRRGGCVCATAECAAGLPPIPTYGCPAICNVKYQFVCTGARIAGAAVGISPINAAGLGVTCILTKALICKKLCNKCDK